MSLATVSSTTAALLFAFASITTDHYGGPLDRGHDHGAPLGSIFPDLKHSLHVFIGLYAFGLTFLSVMLAKYRSCSQLGQWFAGNVRAGTERECVSRHLTLNSTLLHQPNHCLPA